MISWFITRLTGKISQLECCRSSWLQWEPIACIGHLYSIDFPHIVAINRMILYTAQQLQWWNFSQVGSHERHPIPRLYGLASYVLLFVSYRMKDNRNISRAHCTVWFTYWGAMTPLCGKELAQQMFRWLAIACLGPNHHINNVDLLPVSY